MSSPNGDASRTLKNDYTCDGAQRLFASTLICFRSHVSPVQKPLLILTLLGCPRRMGNQRNLRYLHPLESVVQVKVEQ